MRDDSSIDPAGTQQPPQASYASGPTPPQGTQPSQAPPAPPRPAAGGDIAAQPAATQDPDLQNPDPQNLGTQDPGIQQGTTQGQGTQRPATLVSGVRELSIWDTNKADEFRHRWHDVQTHFVEDPRGSVTEARQLVDEAVQTLSESVQEREEQLERAGARSSDSTEGMRDTVLQYHQLLDRLLAV